MNSAAHPSTSFAGLRDFEAAFQAFLELAQNSQQLFLCSSDFAFWPLGTRQTHDLLDHWSQAGRECYLLAESYQRVRNEQPRFVAWRQRWEHIIHAAQAAAVHRGKLPQALFTPTAMLLLVDTERLRGYSSTDPSQIRHLREAFDEVWAKASPAFPPSHTGL